MVQMSMEKIVESRINEMRVQRKRLVEAWKPFVESADRNVQKEGRPPLTEIQKENLAQVLENSLLDTVGKKQLFETTYGSNISFLGIQLPIISALLPSLVLNDIATVQALDRRTGSVFYLDVIAGTTKGDVTAEDTLISAKTGHASGEGARKYASASATHEVITGTSGTLHFASAVAGTVTFTKGTETFTDDGAGVLTSDVSGGGTGTITYTTGAWTITAWAGSGTQYANYFYTYDKASDGVPEVNINVTAESITAVDFPLRAKYSMNAAKTISQWQDKVCELGRNLNFN
jgi:hypothetical protein